MHEYGNDQMRTLIFMTLSLISSGAYAQEWWDIKYHEGSGANSGSFNNNTELIKNLHRDPKLRNQDKVAIGKNEETILESRITQKRIKEMGKEKHAALMDIEGKVLESNDGTLVDCKTCLGSGIEGCSHCLGRGYNECTVCKGSSRICRPCDGTGAINEQTCSTCGGTGKGVCNFCKGKEIIVCAACEGPGYRNCFNCHGLGKEFVPSQDSLSRTLDQELKVQNRDTLSTSELNPELSKKIKPKERKQN